ncbi:ribonucleoside-diphosphate reductase subunit alpha [Virgibacillus dakarensis]|uniref:Ribonucleoside-diphosphate reductase n=1 Tax=Lentibacillus populi TaxID=1827502 RepID=A0A9W5TW18_9BACI|nr:ribonucleoside-diphosphate reductase subunit alpha [Lentibacillus populi]MBT2215227.1 ribonucleoside-diphosphate reductase subunit alpha [Virgibacillus dakarensis]MTW87736.1 ribonucleoside-diphosphate reductase subunit alpha [Virgibacillus dakarensis]GGB35302.1 ribonucleoside-diphosphate reductase [Lentibacillus populi]
MSLQTASVMDDIIAELDAAAQKYHLDTASITQQIKALDVSKEEANQQALFYALNNIAMDQPGWTFVAARMYLNELYQQAATNRGYNEDIKYGDFYQLIRTLSEKGIYAEDLLCFYEKDEIKALEKEIDPERDQLFNYIGLFLLADRYITKDHEHQIYELPQERFMIIAMTLMKHEPKENRLELVKEAYWAMSNLYMTVATPTLANAGKSFGQLSSCFIDTVDDSLDGIYLNNWDIARLSKDGGGIGVYYGKVRALGSDIKKFKGNSSGVVPWIRLLNDTAVSVDQLGQRQGAVAIYLDVFHKDIMNGFLDLKTNNGDERRKAHDIFTGVAIPDLFMEKLQEVDENGRSIGQWHTFCPHQVKQIMGWKDEFGNALGLEDFYDEIDQKYFAEKYEEAVNHPLLPRKTYRAMDIMARIMVAQLETGTPYMFYRDEANRQNPNKHVRGAGRTSIYCSNLCTEIMQNMSATMITNEYQDNEGNIVIVRKPGDFVVCNLSSINLPRAVEADVLDRLIPIQMRMLDNVIDLNTIMVGQAQVTNQKYRAVGLGTFGWHHLLALKGIYWESDQAVAYADELYENIAYHAIRSSMQLAKEKGAYSNFSGSEWQTGAYFNRKGYNKDRWLELREQVAKHGIRNGWLMAVAPNSSTAKIGGSTDGIDPIYAVEYAEEKKNFKFKVTAPDLDHTTYAFYRRSRHELDQHWSIRQNAARQRHVDQSISFNLYVRHDVKARDLLNLHMDAWKQGLKTTYYVRSTSQAEIEECEACHS